ncbi:type II secretion system secretin GspD [Variovorax sp. Sphag1AA]|uniref:type II secretion system secretin GspD n=1 Tax=Variovorax sp. Sphag1AA TaxID=2587027 RepID=UPI00161A852D|nr:type II secretion system secretin GspD [Variovorax sp. Sphag1AA]MBB3177248.1 general secretion pathway protein D [Variovorax sp. Sphag1AA]
MKKPKTSYGARIGTIALAAQMLIAACIPSAFAQDAPRRGEPITLNFTNAEIESVARTMAVVTGRDVVVDPRVKGTVTLQTDRAILPEAAFNQFAAALRLQGFAIVQADGLYKIVPEADAKLQSTSVTTATPTSNLSGNQIVTQIFKLNYESANNLLPVLRPLIAPNNTINVNPGNNSLVITDYAENMRRLARIIASLDVPNASDIEVIPLRHSVATDLVPLVTRLIEGGSGTAGVPGAPPGTADASFRTTLLAEPRSNSLILRAANPARAQLVRTLVEKLDRPPADNGNGAAGNVYVVYLKNADAVRLAATLRAAIAAQGGDRTAGGASATPVTGNTQPAAQLAAAQGTSGASMQATAPVNNANQPSTGGQIQADPSTNSLIITAAEPQYRQLRAVIDKLDGRRAQVMIEALIIEVSATRAAEFGVQWQTAVGTRGVIGTNSSLTGANILALTAALAGGTTSALTTLGTGMNIGIGRQTSGGFVINAIANFLASNQEGNLLSKPNLLTLDNEEAKIVVGQNVPFVTGQFTNTGATNGSVNPFQTIERKDVGLTLRVRPQINENGTIKMTVFQETSTVQPGTENALNGPTTNKRSIESSVLVEDGGLVMLGGLLSDNYSNSLEKIPLAGDIPVLGNLFKNETRSRAKVNLMMFLRPVVVRDGFTTESLAYDRYHMIQADQMQGQPEGGNVMLNNVPESGVLPPPPVRPQSNSSGGGGSSNSGAIEGTVLIPPPSPTSTRLAPSPLRGALPPTADPASSRELP